MNEISKRIHGLIQDSDMSYTDLHTITGIPKSTLQRYATGGTPKIPLDRVILLAQALSSTPEYILGWDTKSPADICGEADGENVNGNIELFNRLSPDKQAEALRFLRYLLSTEECD